MQDMVQVADVFYALYSSSEVQLSADPDLHFWQETQPIEFTADNFGREVLGVATKVFARWTQRNLYLLYSCAYHELCLKPEPQTLCPTPHLWEWDVAEIFIGCDPKSERHYKEFEISPQGEWLDLDVDLDAAGRTQDADWASGFGVHCAIDSEKNAWYGAMRIPFHAIGCVNAPGVGEEFRVNLFRSQGPRHQLLAWKPSMSETFHVPERFGRLILA